MKLLDTLVNLSLKIQLIPVLALIIANNSYAQNSVQDSFLIKIEDHRTGEFCFINKNGDTIVPFGKYKYCTTDTLKHYAIVCTFNAEIWYAIYIKGKVMYQIFPYDSGPDLPSDSLFRIIIDKKTGFAHQKNGEIIIPPEYKCASSFRNGIAMVSKRCKRIKPGRYVRQNEKNWICIDKKGNQIEKPPYLKFDDYIE